MLDRYRAAVTLLAGSGLRIGEALGLEVRHVDFLRRTVRVEQQRLPNGQIGSPKTSSSVRTVPLAGYVTDALAAHLAAFPTDDGLFLMPTGRPLVYHAWAKHWQRAREVAGLPDVVTHDLRHFFASALIAGGASVKAVQLALGHESAAVTLGIYSHLWPGDDDRTRAIIDATFQGNRSDRGLFADSGNESPGSGARS